MTSSKIEFGKFIVVGAVNFCLTFVVFFVLLNYFGFHYLLALCGAWIVGIIFSYAVNYLWVFKPEGNFKFGSRFYKFTLSYALSFFLNLALLSFFVESYSWDPFLVQVGLVPVVVLLNYSSSKYWSLRRSRVS